MHSRYGDPLMKTLLATLGTLLLLSGAALAGETKSLDAAFKDQAAKILQYSRDHGCKNVGVLKFLVRTGDGPFSDNAGPLNLGLSDRLTVALVLACPDDEIGILRDANAQATKISGANHLDEEGRAKL